MMQLTLVRHLPTSWNIKGILQGDKNIPILKPDYIARLKIKSNILEYNLHEKKFDFIVVSQKKRTTQTAIEYGFSRKQLAIDSLVNEIDFANYQGRHKKDVIEEIGDLWYSNIFKTPLHKEALELECRIKEFLLKYRACKKVLVFTHGAFMRGLLEYIEKNSIAGMNKRSILNNQVLVYSD